MGDNVSGLAKPLSLWEKVKVGVSSFVSSAISYLPRGLMFAGAIMGVSLLAGMAIPGADLLNVANTFNNGGVGALAMTVGKTLLVGGLISGGLGAYKGIEHATHQREGVRAKQAGIVARHHGLGHVHEQHLAYDEPVSPQADLPMGAGLSKQHTIV